ncbi:GNAT family N-acetyltransferase [Acetomicrobium sp.]|uniref:GNAT family N-acetyltransferase n=1 Tax=Acetomicrobium sp. TaxID=1872099 RepID=UPI002B261C95|nr:GNAT family N-acetyltransferase [Acetomicrobium sp.]
MNQLNRPYTKYLNIARSSKAFNEAELQVLEGLLRQCLEGPNEEGYIMLTEKEDGEDVAFLIYGKTPMTEFTYDLYWVVVSPSHQGKGFGRRIISRMEQCLLKGKDKVNIRVETSGSEHYVGQRAFYEAMNFNLCGRIPSFYKEGDDLVIYYKCVMKNYPSGGSKSNERL